MNVVDIMHWARQHGDPIPDICHRLSYRCSAYLVDGTYLPCVQLREAGSQTDLAVKRLQEVQNDRRIIASFVNEGNRVSAHEIGRLERSPYSIPLERLKEVRGETSMSWTAFAAVMDDGREFSFGTSYSMEFFEMPQGYDGRRIQTIVPHRNQEQPVYREKPFFVCFLEKVQLGAA